MSGFVLKIIALASMIIDHVGCTYKLVFDTSMLRAIGRMAFPIYIFLIAEGCRYTKDLKKYMFRLGIFALISEFPFDFIFKNAEMAGPHPLYYFDLDHQNVFFTLFLGVLAIYLYENRKNWEGQKLPLKNPFRYWTTWAAILMGGLLRTDYGPFGVFFIVLTYSCADGCELSAARKRQILSLFIMSLILYLGLSPYYLLLIFFACLSLVCIYFYNGQRGPSLRWLFYAAYPLHLGVLGILWYFYVAPVLLNYTF